MNLRTTTLILLLAAALPYCSKKEERYHYENKKEELKLQYTGSDSSVHSVVNQLNTSAFTTRMGLDSLGETHPDFDRHLWGGKLGDSLHYLLVPFVNKQDVLVSYLRVGLFKKVVTDVSRIAYVANYMNANDSAKGWRGVELAALQKAGIQLPEGFDTGGVQKALEKEGAAMKVANRKSRRQSAAKAEQNCSYYIQCYYFASCEPDVFNAIFLNEYRSRMAQLGANVDIWGYSAVNVTGLPDAVGAAVGVFYETLSYVSNLQSCNVSVQNVTVTTDCSENGGGDTPPLDPCAASCEAQAASLYSSAQVTSELLPAEVIATADPFVKDKNPRWIALKNLFWNLKSEEKGTVKLINVQQDKWQWEKLEHSQIVFAGISPGGVVTVESQQGTPSFHEGTPNVLYAGMELIFTVKYSVVCDCDLPKIITPVFEYKATAIFDANPKNEVSE